MRAAWVLVLLVATEASAAPDARGFVVVGGGGKAPSIVTTTGRWDLYTLYGHDYVDGSPQSGGMQLTTRGTPGGVVGFETRRRDAQVRCGDLVAVSIQGAWLRFDASRRPLELSLVVKDTTPSDELFQWRIAGCRVGDPLATGAPFALANVLAKDALVGCKRVYGPPFCWDEQQLMGLERKKEQ